MYVSHTHTHTHTQTHTHTHTRARVHYKIIKLFNLLSTHLYKFLHYYYM